MEQPILIGTNLSIFFSIVFCAVVVEGIVAYSKMFVKDGKVCWECIVAIIAGIVVSVGFGLDLFSLLGIPSKYPFFGSIITGLVICRGSNYIFDLMKRVHADTEERKAVASTINNNSDDKDLDIEILNNNIN